MSSTSEQVEKISLSVPVQSKDIASPSSEDASLKNEVESKEVNEESASSPVPESKPADNTDSAEGHTETESSDSDSIANSSNTTTSATKTKTKYLRKGKWTTEEELFTNKAIELFNKGLLKLDEESKGITLRAYLANKLECDPMRITKKYTGAYCLGKRVYQFDHLNVTQEEIEKANDDLSILEKNFHRKLELLNKKNSTSESAAEAPSVSTPAIDALLRQDKLLNNDPKVSSPVSSKAASPVSSPAAPIAAPVSPVSISVPNKFEISPAIAAVANAIVQSNSPYNLFNPLLDPATACRFPQFYTYPLVLNHTSTATSGGRFLFPTNPPMNTVNSDCFYTSAASAAYPFYYINPSFYSKTGQPTEDKTANSPAATSKYPSYNSAFELISEKRKVSSEEKEVVSKRCRLINEEESAAANSLLGLFNHVKNNQEDLKDFFQGVSKSSSAKKLIPSSL